MKFCSKCGTPFEEGQSFCKKCGNKLNNEVRQVNNVKQSIPQENKIGEKKVDKLLQVSDDPKVESNVVSNNPSDNTNRNNFKVNKKAAIGIVIAFILLAIGAAGYFIGNSLTQPSKVIANFKSDIAANNQAALAKLLYCDDSRLTINQKSLDPLMKYFKDNPDYLNKVVDGLNKQSLTLSNSSIPATNSKNMFQLLSVGKKYLLFPNYKINIKPAFITVKAGSKDVAILLDNKEIGKSNTDNFSKQFGPYLPGEYVLSANFKGKYASLNETHDLDLVTSADNKSEIEVLNNLTYLNIGSDHPDAELYVNNTDTGIKVSAASNFGPLDPKSKVYAIITKDGQSLKSNEYTPGEGDNNNVFLSFEQSERTADNVKNQLHDLINWYTNSFTQAVNTNDFTIVQPYLYPGSSLFKDQLNYIPSTYKRGVTENIMSYKITGYNISNDNESGTITTQEIYNINDNGNSSIKTFNYKYTFKYNDEIQGYQLASISTN